MYVATPRAGRTTPPPSPPSHASTSTDKASQARCVHARTTVVMAWRSGNHNTHHHSRPLDNPPTAQPVAWHLMHEIEVADRRFVVRASVTQLDGPQRSSGIRHDRLDQPKLHPPRTPRSVLRFQLSLHCNLADVVRQQIHVEDPQQLGGNATIHVRRAQVCNVFVSATCTEFELLALDMDAFHDTVCPEHSVANTSSNERGKILDEKKNEGNIPHQRV